MRECDLIMKGGITSGVVYPHAIVEIAATYRLRNIGGASAGAIAAVIAAAAEYRRQTEGSDAGFDAIKDIATELGDDLGALFQPSPGLEQPFDVLREVVSSGRNPVLAVMRAWRGRVFVGALLGGAPAIFAAIFGQWGFAAFFALLALVLIVILVVADIYDLFSRRLPAADFGLCTGKTRQDATSPAFSDWIADRIDAVAGRSTAPDAPPLTVGDLEDFGVGVAAITTDLSTQRPYQLPLRERRFRVRKSEMEQLFPKRIVDYLCAPERASPGKHADDPDDLFALPVGREFPVALVARMSLSFPGLISGVPLWRVDYDAQRDARGEYPMARLLFSDGGISSNFPVHFFDAPIPQRPTFGIKLGPYEKAIHKDERVDLPKKPSEVQRLRTGEIKSVPAFLFAILNTAKDWRDTLQSQLPAYAQRIVEIRLDDESEGGINFTMPAEVIERIQGYGEDAGKKLTEAYAADDHDGFDQHRYHRMVSLLPAAETMLETLAAAYRARPAGAGDEARTGEEVLLNLDAKHARAISKTERRDVIAPFAEALAAIGEAQRAAREDPDRKSVDQTGVPAQDAHIRLVAHSNRVPQDGDDGGV